MTPDRKEMYKMPFSLRDNQGAWIEVTDHCNMHCFGCYRNKLSGHKPLQELFYAIDESITTTNCDEIVIAGGEPLIYPQLEEVISYISHKKVKTLLLTNGVGLTRDKAINLKKAGLSKIHFHIDTLQNREGWSGKTEDELNELRQYYADLLWDVKGIQCGFHVTVNKQNFDQALSVYSWGRKNIKKVQHLSLIALRGIPVRNEIDYYAGNDLISRDNLPNSFNDTTQIDITTDDLYQIIKNRFPDMTPGCFINGNTLPDVNKYLIFESFGSNKHFYGVMGAKTFELIQIIYHLFFNRYLSFPRKTYSYPLIFILTLVDKYMRKAFKNFLKVIIRNPSYLFRKIYLQTLILQQPIEFVGDKKNSCDSCVNPMFYQNKFINPCQLDEYRLFNEEITAKHTFI